MEVVVKLLREILCLTTSTADLGSSSKYSNKKFEGRSDERFHDNSNWSWVSRS